jgi:hypothetical protein
MPCTTGPPNLELREGEENGRQRDVDGRHRQQRGGVSCDLTKGKDDEDEGDLWRLGGIGTDGWQKIRCCGIG